MNELRYTTYFGLVQKFQRRREVGPRIEVTMGTPGSLLPCLHALSMAFRMICEVIRHKVDACFTRTLVQNHRSGKRPPSNKPLAHSSSQRSMRRELSILHISTNQPRLILRSFRLSRNPISSSYGFMPYLSYLLPPSLETPFLMISSGLGIAGLVALRF